MYESIDDILLDLLEEGDLEMFHRVAAEQAKADEETKQKKGKQKKGGSK